MDVIFRARVSGADCCLVTPSVVGSFISDGFLLNVTFLVAVGVLRFLFYELIFLPEEEEGLAAIDCHGNGHVWIAGESMDKSRPLNEFSLVLCHQLSMGPNSWS